MIVAGEAGIGKTRLVRRVRRPRRVDGRPGPDRRLPAARDRRPAVRPVRRGVPRPVPRARSGCAAGAARSQPRRARPADARAARPARPTDGGRSRQRRVRLAGRQRRPVRAGAPVRARPRCRRPARPRRAGRLRHRGPPVGRSVDAGPARLPRPQPARRTRPAGGHDPDRRARAAPRGDDLPRRARARGARRSHRPRAARPRRPRAPARRRARPDARAGPGGADLGAHRRATRSTPSRSWPPPARRATASCRRACATSCSPAWRPCRRPARRCSGWPRRPAPGSTTSW